MTAPPAQRTPLAQPAELENLHARALFERPPRPSAPVPTPEDQDKAETYARALKRVRVHVGDVVVSKAEVLEASLYKHAIKTRMAEGAPTWAATLQTTIMDAIRQLQQQQQPMAGRMDALVARMDALQQQVTANQDAITARHALSDARKLNRRIEASDLDSPIAWPVNATREALPAQHPTNTRELRTLSAPQCNAMLAYYDLDDTQGLVEDKRTRLACYLRVKY